ncbi:SRX, signal recognition particle receptor alpha subunit [Nakaseomyces glabratus]|nr:hypothetical protein LTX96_0003294 [Nakaseomyces glabratus]
MFEQLTIFTPQGEVLYYYNCYDRKFAEAQVNAVISHLLTSPISRDHGSSKYKLLSIPSVSKNAKPFTVLSHVSKQPELYFIITYPEPSMELNNEAQEVLDVAIALWDSLPINDIIIKAAKGTGKKNAFNCIDISGKISEDIEKFDNYLRTKYNESIKVDQANTNINSDEIRAESPGAKKKSKAKKPIKGGNNRKWGIDGALEETGNDSGTLDFSDPNAKPTGEMSQNVDTNIDTSDFGSKSKSGDFLIKEIDDILSQQQQQKSSSGSDNNGYTKSAFGFLQKHLLGNKTITEKDIHEVLEKFKQKLITKNVSPEAADYLLKQVSRDLVGSRTDNWTSVENTVKQAVSKSLTEVLTPGVSVDLLHEIQKKTGNRSADGKKNPYVFSVVGVNGVGKSTNLSKLAFWLLQNNFRILIVACDTFRSGAVEQLRVHVENLAQLMDEKHIRGSKNSRGKSGNDYIELFEAGYGGSDLVTKIAKQAIKYAKEQDFDIVLMDTAGRRHNDPTLMSPLKNFAEQANPDKIIMVGEALVGTDSVQQARNFNNAFGKNRNLDFFIISKCDTVGEMLGTMVNMVYATGIPILFVGVGQTYTDLRTLSVNWAVNTLMS